MRQTPESIAIAASGWSQSVDSNLACAGHALKGLGQGEGDPEFHGVGFNAWSQQSGQRGH
jgi:hypothetical protein